MYKERKGGKRKGFKEKRSTPYYYLRVLEYNPMPEITGDCTRPNWAGSCIYIVRCSPILE